MSANPGDPNQVAVGDEHGVVAVWDLRAGRVLDQFERQHDGIVRRLMYHPKDHYLVSGGEDGRLVLMDLGGGGGVGMGGGGGGGGGGGVEELWVERMGE